LLHVCITANAARYETALQQFNAIDSCYSGVVFTSQVHTSHTRTRSSDASTWWDRASHRVSIIQSLSSDTSICRSQAWLRPSLSSPGSPCPMHACTRWINAALSFVNNRPSQREDL